MALVLPEDRWAIFAFAQSLFDERMEFLTTEAETLWKDMESRLSDVLEAAINISLIDTVTVTIDDIPEPELDANRPMPPARVEWEATWPSPPATISPPSVDLSDIEQPSGDITLPLVHVEVGETEYISDLLTVIREKIETDIESGQTGLDPAVEVEIWERNLERDLQERDDALDRVREEWSKMDWPLPDGVLSAALTDVETKFSDKRHDVSREIASKQAELTYQGMKDRLASGIDIEKGLMSLFSEIQTRIQKASAAEMEAEISLYTAQVNRLNALTSLYKTLVDARIEEAKAIVEVYVAQVEAYSKTVQAESDRIGAIIRAYIGEVDSYKAEIEAYASLNDLQIKIFDGRIRAAIAKAEIAIKNADIQFQNASIKEQLELKALDVILSAMTQLEAGLIGSINLSARVDASNSANYNYKAPASIEEVLQLP